VRLAGHSQGGHGSGGHARAVYLEGF